MTFHLHLPSRYSSPNPGIAYKLFRRTSLALCLAIVIIFGPATWGQSPAPGRHRRVLNAVIRSDGTYQLSFATMGWILSGSLPQPGSKVASSTGKDGIGSYHQISAPY